MRQTILLLAPVLLLTALAAQNPIAFPQESTATSAGNFIPLGYSKLDKNYREGRFQQRVPARYLASNPAVITGLDMATLAGPGSTSITYKSLKILSFAVLMGAGLHTHEDPGSSLSSELRNKRRMRSPVSGPSRIIATRDRIREQGNLRRCE